MLRQHKRAGGHCSIALRAPQCDQLAQAHELPPQHGVGCCCRHTPWHLARNGCSCVSFLASSKQKQHVASAAGTPSTTSPPWAALSAGSAADRAAASAWRGQALAAAVRGVARGAVSPQGQPSPPEAVPAAVTAPQALHAAGNVPAGQQLEGEQELSSGAAAAPAQSQDNALLPVQQLTRSFWGSLDQSALPHPSVQQGPGAQLQEAPERIALEAGLTGTHSSVSNTPASSEPGQYGVAVQLVQRSVAPALRSQSNTSPFAHPPSSSVAPQAEELSTHHAGNEADREPSLRTFSAAPRPPPLSHSRMKSPFAE